jgi:hypothetical protein
MPAQAERRRDDASKVLQEFSSQDQTASGLAKSRSIRQELQERFQERLRGYAGWLVLQPQFQADAAVTFRRHAAVIDAAERTLSAGGYPLEGTQLAYLGAKTALCKHWMLDAVTANSVPDPTWPGIRPEPSRDDLEEELGVSMFIPWPLLVDTDLKVREVIDFQQARRNLDYLAPWFGKKQWGVERLARLLDLYVYGDLALSRRYGARLGGQQENIDEAFASYWRQTSQRGNSDGVETVRKTRQFMQRELRKVATAVKKAVELYEATGQRPPRNGYTKYDEQS